MLTAEAAIFYFFCILNLLGGNSHFATGTLLSGNSFTSVKIMDIRAVIFDLDGTLLDTESLSALAIQQVLTRLDCTIPMSWDIQKRLLGLRGPDWTSIVINEMNLHDLTNSTQFINEWEKNLGILCRDANEMPGAEHLTAKLGSMGVKLAIATSSRAAAVEVKRIKHQSIFGRMSQIVCGDDPEVLNGKPAPDIYLTAARRLGVEPCHCLAIEDSLSGVQSAKRAGMHVCACPDIRLDLNPFREETPHILANSSLEAFDWDAWRFS
jgi:beta-phosphoglucomutase-like phosphatase (HAD superfamily)